MQICQNIIFGSDLQVDDDGDSADGSNIDWQMQALQLSDDNDDEGVMAGIIVNNLSVLVNRPLHTVPMVLLQ